MRTSARWAAAVAAPASDRWQGRGSEALARNRHSRVHSWHYSRNSILLRRAFSARCRLTLSEPLVRRVSAEVCKRALLEHEMLHRFALARRQACERAGDGAGRVGVSEPP